MHLAIYFGNPFWVGVVELPADNGPRVVRHVFAAEPISPEVFQFVLHDLDALIDRVHDADPQGSIAPPATTAAAAQPFSKTHRARSKPPQHFYRRAGSNRKGRHQIFVQQVIL